MIGIKPSIKIIISRYNEDLKWTEDLKNVIIYNKGNKDIISNHKIIDLPNVGREGHTYYTHIYNNYNNLDDYTIFLQGNPFDHSPNIINDVLKFINDPENIDFKFLSSKIHTFNLKKGCPYHHNLPLIEVYNKLFYDENYNINVEFGTGAQFIVSKETILLNPLSIYKNIIDILGYDINPIEGFVIERFHKLIFNCNDTENYGKIEKYNNNYGICIYIVLFTLFIIFIFIIKLKLQLKIIIVCVLITILLYIIMNNKCYDSFTYPCNIADWKSNTYGLCINNKIKNERVEAIEYFLNMCYLKYRDENILKIPFNTNDRGNKNENIKEYSMCYNKNKEILKKYCGPDWTFYNWKSASINSFEDMKNQIIIESNKDPTINKIGWFGNINSPLSDVPEYKTRPLLKKIGDENKDIFDIKNISPINGIIDKSNRDYLSTIDLIKYKYLIDIGGNGYSGRLKYLLFSKRPLLIIDRAYIEYFHDNLIPYIHYIPVKEDLSDLLQQVKWMTENYQKSLEIANNAYKFAMDNFTLDKIIDRVYYVYQNINNN
jgi:hypothetical protein